MDIQSSKKPDNFSPLNVDDNFSDRTLVIKIVDDSSETERSDDEDQEIYSSKCVRLITIEVNSRMLADKSPFFQKMFFNGMRESNARVATMIIDAHEEAAFMDLMDFTKSNPLPSTNPLELVDLLILADKYEVSSRIDSLLSLPMNMELALVYSDLPNTMVKQSAMEFFTETLKTLDELPEDIGDVNQDVIEAVLARDDLPMDLEDVAYDFLMKWVTTHFSDLEGRREFLRSRVRNLIRFPNLSPSKRNEFDECPYAENELKTEIRAELESYESEKRRPQGDSLKKLVYANRFYRRLTVVVEKPKKDDNGYKVFLELSKQECRNLAQFGKQKSNTFKVKDHEFHLEIDCKYKEKKPSTLGMSLHMENVQRITIIRFEVAYEAQRNEFVRMAGNVNIVLNRRKKGVGYSHLLGSAEWDAFMASDSKFFINGSMLIKATIHVK